MYVYVSSKDSSAEHVDNTNFDYLYELPLELDLEGSWSCALLEIILEKKINTCFYVYCDIVQNSVVHGKMLPILRVIRDTNQYEKPYYVPLVVNSVKRIRIYIKTKDGQTPNIAMKDCMFVIHFRKNKSR